MKRKPSEMTTSEIAMARFRHLNSIFVMDKTGFFLLGFNNGIRLAKENPSVAEMSHDEIVSLEESPVDFLFQAKGLSRKESR